MLISTKKKTNKSAYIKIYMNMKRAYFIVLLLIAASISIAQESDPERILLVRSDTPFKTSGINLVEKDLEGASGAIAADYMNFLDFPSYMAIGATNSEELAYSAGLYVASQLSALGVTALYGLRFDNITSRDVSIGTRAFGSEIDLVCRMAKSFSMGIKDGGLRCIGIISNATDENIKCAVDSGVDALVLRDKEAVKKVRDAGFKGALITSLISENVDERVREALLSGYDLVQVRSSDVERTKTVIRGLDIDIKSSLDRVDALLKKIAVKSDSDSDTPIKVARRAVSMVIGNRVRIPENASVGVITDNSKFIAEVKALRENVSFYGYDSYEAKDYLVLCIEGEKGRMLIPELASGDKIIILSLGFPMDVFYYAELKNYLTVYGNDSSSLKAAAETIFGSNLPVGTFPLRAPRTKIMNINYATEGKKELKAIEGSSGGALLFNADYSLEKRMAKVGLHPSSAGIFVANATVGAAFSSPVQGGGSLNVQVEFNGNIRGVIDDSLTTGSFEVVAGIKDLTTNESYGTQVLFKNATKEEIDQSFTATVNATLTQGHRYFAYIEVRARQDASVIITGKIDLWSDDYGVWYDSIVIWV